MTNVEIKSLASMDVTTGIPGGFWMPLSPVINYLLNLHYIISLASLSSHPLISVRLLLASFFCQLRIHKTEPQKSEVFLFWIKVVYFSMGRFPRLEVPPCMGKTVSEARGRWSRGGREGGAGVCLRAGSAFPWSWSGVERVEESRVNPSREWSALLAIVYYLKIYSKVYQLPSGQ